MPVFFQGFCPYGEQCSKGNRQLICDKDRSKVVAAVANHLASSSYHQMDWEQAQLEADSDHVILEQDFEEQKEVEQEAEVDKGEGKGEGKSKGSKSKRSKKGSSAPSSGSGGRQHETQLALRSPRRRSRSRSPRRVEIRASQLQTILDSLERAAQASEYSATLSRTAAKAFEDQAATLRTSQRLVQEALVHSTRR